MSKRESEQREQYNKIFIEQAPTAIAMLDKDMRYIAVSQRWITDYKMQGKEIIGQSHYDLFPEIGEDAYRRYNTSEGKGKGEEPNVGDIG